MSLGTGLGRLKGRAFRIGHLGDFNDLMLMGTLCGVEMGLALAGMPFRRGGVDAALDDTRAVPSNTQRPASAADEGRPPLREKGGDAFAKVVHWRSRRQSGRRSRQRPRGGATAIRRSASFVARIVSGALRAIVAARSPTTSAMSACSAMRVTKPSASASPASITRAGQEQILRAAGPIRSTRRGIVGGREAVAERPGDRHAELRGRRAHAQIAGERDRRSRRRRRRPDLRDRRHRDTLEPIDHGVQPSFVRDAVVAGRELRELLNVGAGCKGVAVRAQRRARGSQGRRRRGRTPRRARRTSPTSWRCGLRGGSIEREHTRHDRPMRTDAFCRGVDMSSGPARARRDSRARRHAGDGRSVLRDATMRHGRRRDQGRAARRRFDAPDGRAHRARTAPRSTRSIAASAASCSTSRPLAAARAPTSVAGADILIENYRPGVMRRFGLDYATLAAGISRAHLRVNFGLRPDRP